MSRDLGRQLALHLDGVYSHTIKFPVGVMVNTPDAVTGLKPLPEWGHGPPMQKGTDGAYDYRALLVRLERRYSNNYMRNLSHTLAKQESAWRTATHFGR